MDAPLRIALGYNNVYAVDGPGGRVLIDTGPDYTGAAAALVEQLGTPAPAVVVATHGHLDHAGLGRFWVERGVPVAVAEADVHLAAAPHAPSDADFSNLRRYVEGSGAPERRPRGAAARPRRAPPLGTRRRALRATTRPAGRDGRWPSGLHYERFEPTRRAGPGRLPEAPDLDIVPAPGTRPATSSLWTAEDGWLFSGDQLLPDITPTPAIQRRPRAAKHATGASAASRRSSPRSTRSATQHFSRCFPGHGEPFDNVTGVIDANLAQIEQRTARVLATLTAAGRGSVYALCEALYPRALRRRFWQIAATVQGHLDLLEQRGQVVLVDGGYEPIR